MMSFKFTLP